jgi:hypothetical protein
MLILKHTSSIYFSLCALLSVLAMTFVTTFSFFPIAVNATGINTSNNLQTWFDKLNNLKIVFTYLPEKPIIDSPTELKFVVMNPQTTSHLTGLSARVVVLTNSSGQERYFKFTNITAPDGTFSVKYLFPDTGLYEVITTVNSKTFVTLASFNVFVPLSRIHPSDFTSRNKAIQR